MFYSLINVSIMEVCMRTIFRSNLFPISIVDLDFTFLEMNPFTLVNEKPYPLDMRGELDDTAAFKNFNKYSFLTYMLRLFVVNRLSCKCP